ncbi:hypothetical protein ACO2Q3_23015 [Caulobacter sp. KR2-114]
MARDVSPILDGTAELAVEWRSGWLAGDPAIEARMATVVQS